MNTSIEIKEASITSEDAITLLDELNATLTQITGASGEASFAADDMCRARSVFVIAYIGGNPCGCGALRSYGEHTAEIKRVYARPNSFSVGSSIVKALEEKAVAFGYSDLLLETRKINSTAVAFYQKLGYQICPNYGKYANRADAVCMQKKL